MFKTRLFYMPYTWDEQYIEGKDTWTDDKSLWLLDFLKKNAVSQGKALDIGCGSGDKSDLLLKQGFDVVGIDLSKVAIEQARAKYPKIKFHQVDIDQEGIPESLGKFDLIIDIKTLFFLNDKSKYVAEIKKALNDDGVFIIQVFTEHFKPIFIQSEELSDIISEFTVVDKITLNNHPEGKIVSECYALKLL